jgi:hypothetical protein
MLKPTNAQIVKPSGTAAAPSEKLHRRDAADSSNKENQRPQVEVVADDLAGINIGATVPGSSPEHTVTKSYDSDDPVVQAEKELHQRFTEEALDMVSEAVYCWRFPLTMPSSFAHGDLQAPYQPGSKRTGSTTSRST